MRRSPVVSSSFEWLKGSQQSADNPTQHQKPGTNIPLLLDHQDEWMDIARRSKRIGPRNDSGKADHWSSRVSFFQPSFLLYNEQQRTALPLHHHIIAFDRPSFLRRVTWSYHPKSYLGIFCAADLSSLDSVGDIFFSRFQKFSVFPVLERWNLNVEHPSWCDCPVEMNNA